MRLTRRKGLGLGPGWTKKNDPTQRLCQSSIDTEMNLPSCPHSASTAQTKPISQFHPFAR